MSSIIKKLNADSKIAVSFGTTKDDPPRFVVGYWSIRGLGAPLRMMLHAAKVDHIVAMYDVIENQTNDESWNLSTYLGDKNWLKKDYNSFCNLPFVVDTQVKNDDGKELVVVQTNACFMYLGRELNMMGKNNLEMVKCEELLCEIMDLRNNMVKFAYGGNSSEIMAWKMFSSSKKILNKLEAYLKSKKGSCYLVGEQLSAPDFHLFEMLDQFDGLCKVYGSKFEDEYWPCYPCLKEFITAFSMLPENQNYLQSDLHCKIPYNNTRAIFSSALENKTYVRGQDAPWRKMGSVEVIYNKRKQPVE